MHNKDDIHTVTKFNELLEMVASADFQKYKDFDLDADVSDDKYDDIALVGDLKAYNTKQLKALKDYATRRLPGKSDGEIEMFMVKALSNPKTHKVMRQHIAYHNPELFDYINKQLYNHSFHIQHLIYLVAYIKEDLLTWHL